MDKREPVVPGGERGKQRAPALRGIEQGDRAGPAHRLEQQLALAELTDAEPRARPVREQQHDSAAVATADRPDIALPDQAPALVVGDEARRKHGIRTWSGHLVSAPPPSVPS